MIEALREDLRDVKQSIESVEEGGSGSHEEKKGV